MNISMGCMKKKNPSEFKIELNQGNVKPILLKKLVNIFRMVLRALSILLEVFLDLFLVSQSWFKLFFDLSWTIPPIFYYLKILEYVISEIAMLNLIDVKWAHHNQIHIKIMTLNQRLLFLSKFQSPNSNSCNLTNQQNIT